jgi:hypothetical protein
MAGGAQKLQLDEKSITKLASYGCTVQEIAGLLGCSVPTVYNFKEALEAGQAGMKESIRRERFKIAMDPNHPKQASMLIFLSKTVLGEKEYEVIDNGLNAAPKLKIEFVSKSE